MKTRARWVIKAGSQMVVSGGPLLVRDWMRQVAELRKAHGIDIVWVTSGAIATAVERVRFEPPRGRKRTLAEKQALSAIGQPLVMDTYGLSLAAVGLMGAQVLLTSEDLAASERRRNFQATIDQLLSWGVTPILNENDAVSTAEIQFGDNDSLSAQVAKAIGAERLVILTDVAGLYDSDPRKNSNAQLVAELSRVTPAILAQVKPGAGSVRGTGGMLSKLQAAQVALKAGIPTWLMKGDEPRVLARLAAGESPGTRIGEGGPRNARMRRGRA